MRRGDGRVNERIHSLQALRFVAAAMVVLLHVEQGARGVFGLSREGGAFANIGSFGVDIFFVLSGYVICLTAPTLSPAAFLRKRVVRVVPIYWLATLAFLPFAIAAGTFEAARGIGSITFYPGFGLPWLSVGWTLCFEMLFYAVTAVVLIDPRRLLPLALATYALCWAARVEFGGAFRFFGNPIVLEFLFGAALTRLTARSPLLSLAAAAAGLALLATVEASGIDGANNVLGLLAGETSLARVAVMGLPAALLIWAALGVPLGKGRLSYLGDTSYALYLVHPHIVAAALLVLPAMPVPLFTAAIAVAAVLAGIAVHEHVEKPLLAALRRPPRPIALAPAL